MNENAPTLIPETSQESSAANSPRPLRLKFPGGLVLVFWVLHFVVGNLDKPYFYGFLFQMASAGLFVLLFFIWWWFNRGVRFREKFLGFVLIVAGGVITGTLSHRSITGWTLFLAGLPLVITVVVGWMFLTKRKLISPNRLGFVAAVALTWSWFLVIRTDGLQSTLKPQNHWRWTPSAEESFLAQSAQAGRAAGSSQSPAAPRPPHAGQVGSNIWTAFRGPNRDGVVRGSHIPTDWKSTPPSQLWKQKVGPAWSSVIVIDDRIYTQEQRGAMETVVCYDAATGRQLWIHEDAARFDESVSGIGPRATPSFASGTIVTLGGTGVLNCLDAETGERRWSRDIKKDSGGAVPMWGFAGSPLIIDDRVIVYGGGESGKGLLAYRLSSGELIWAAAAGQNSYSSPQLATLAGKSQCLMLHDFGLTAVDPATGEKLWETGLVMKGAPRSGQPRLIGETKLAVASLSGPGLSLIEVGKNGDRWKVSELWASKEFKPEFPDFVVYEGNAYGFDVSIFSCVNLANGKRCWKEGRFGRGQVILLADQSLLLVSSESGELILLAADPQSQRELGRFQALQGKTWNHPVFANGLLYLRNAEEMACYRMELAAQAAVR